MGSFEIFSLEILITFLVAVPLVFTPIWFVATKSRRVRWWMTGVWCAIGLLISLLARDGTYFVEVLVRFFGAAGLYWVLRWLWFRVWRFFKRRFSLS